MANDEDSEDRERTNELVHDLRRATEVQLSFVPRSPPEAEGFNLQVYYQAAQGIGGDYADFIPIADGRTAIVIADVVGHGLEAALIMARLAIETRVSLTNCSGDPALAIQRLNSALCEVVSERFITLLCFVIDPRSETATIVNAGHVAPLVLSARDGKLSEPSEEESGLPLGITEDLTFESVDISFGPGDVAVMHTDGIFEAMNSKHEELGIEKVRQLTAQGGGAEKVKERIVHAVSEHVAGAIPFDDACLVVVERVDVPGELVPSATESSPNPVAERSLVVTEPRTETIADRYSKFSPGTAIDRYTIVRRISEGVFAQVYLADDADLNRQVVLRFNRLLQPISRFESLIEDAASTLAGLNHPHILAVYDIGTYLDLRYVVCEYAPGSLAAEISGLATSDVVHRVRDVMANVSHAVDYLHRRGIVHRNINPKTIRIDVSGRPKLASFELAVRAEEVPANVAGTLEYMAPEQIAGDAQRMGPAADIWALGATAYHALAGRTPFQGQSLEELKKSIAENDPLPIRRFNSHVPQGLERACFKCLSKSPSQRYTTAESVARAFRESSVAMSAPRTRVFVSHSSLDRQLVESEIISLLEKSSIDTWYSKADIQTAAEWERSILSGLQSCDIFLLVMSPNSCRSEWVKDELFWAIENRHDRLVPVMVADCDPRQFHMRLARIEYVDFQDNVSWAQSRLIESLKNLSKPSA